MRHGLTLTSLMVAVALSGVLAVAGTRLVVNQMNAFRVLELKDKGESIFEFYSNLLHDDKVWWCILYDGRPATPPPSPNSAMRNCVLGRGACASSGTLQLVGPDCRLQFTAQGARDFTAGNFRPGTLFIPAGGGGITLKDSATQGASDGWWNVAVTWEHKGNRAVDLILTQKLNEARWKTAPAAGKRHLPQLDYPRTLRVRRSANYVSTSSDTTRAVTKIALHTVSRTVGRHTDPLVDTTTSGLGNCHQQTPFGQVVKSVGTRNACSGDRVAVTPTNKCSRLRSVITQIGKGAGLTGVDNIRCALDGSGKLVRHGTCGRRRHVDRCTVAGGPTFRTRKLNVPEAITRIDQWGRLVCEGLPSWPSITPRTITPPATPSWWYPQVTPTARYTVYGQGDIGPKGYPGRSNVQGDRGYAYNSSRCS